MNFMRKQFEVLFGSFSFKKKNIMSYTWLSKYRSELMGVAMIWVMLFHAWLLDLRLPVLKKLRELGFGGVDIFLFLSALGLAMSLARREQPYGTFVQRRFSRVLPAYYLVVPLYALWQWWTGAIPLSTVGWDLTLLAYWVRAEGAFNWYIPALLVFYLLTPPCVALLRRVRHRFLLALAVTVGGVALCQWMTALNLWGWLDFFYRVPIYFIGFWVGLMATEDRKISIPEALGWLALLGAGMAFLALRKYSPTYVATCYLFIFTTVPCCLLGAFCLEKLPLEWLAKPLRLLGQCSLEIYLLNASLFIATNQILSKLTPGAAYYGYYFCVFVLNIAMGVGLHFAMEWGRKAVSGFFKERKA